VHHGVDATALGSTLLPRLPSPVALDCVVFNFPHHPGKGRIQRNRDLVRDFLHNVCVSVCVYMCVWVGGWLGGWSCVCGGGWVGVYDIYLIYMSRL
jgi:hypothetical protein